jgi:hypothetical protein
LTLCHAKGRTAGRLYIELACGAAKGTGDAAALGADCGLLGIGDFGILRGDPGLETGLGPGATAEAGGDCGTITPGREKFEYVEPARGIELASGGELGVGKELGLACGGETGGNSWAGGACTGLAGGISSPAT